MLYSANVRYPVPEMTANPRMMNGWRNSPPNVASRYCPRKIVINCKKQLYLVSRHVFFSHFGSQIDIFVKHSIKLLFLVIEIVTLVQRNESDNICHSLQCLCLCLSVSVSFCLSVCLSVCRSVGLSVCFCPSLKPRPRFVSACARLRAFDATSDRDSAPEFKYETFPGQWIPLNLESEVSIREQVQRRLPRTDLIHINWT